MPFSRAIVIVLDGLGVGELPDAAGYSDQGSNTLGNIARQVPLHLPTLAELGLSQIVPLTANPASCVPRGAYGRMAEQSPGKDSVTGHWELTGIVLDTPFPTFPQGFPATLIDEFVQRIGRPVLGNVVASGTAIIDLLGEEHVRSALPIVYTSADSVFQIAAHEQVVPLATLYEWCEVAYALAVTGHGVGRVIARPFVGNAGTFRRTSNRHDYAMPPIRETLLDRLTEAGTPVTAIGKIHDLFAGRGIADSYPTVSDEDGMARLEQQLTTQSDGLLFVNLVDFDALFGHRNDVAGYAANLERFDQRLSQLLPQLQVDDLLVITADHGNDPSTPSTDHSREYVPLLVTGSRVRAGVDLGTRETFADLSQTLSEVFQVGCGTHGHSFLRMIEA